MHTYGIVEVVLQDNFLRTMDLSTVVIEGVDLSGDSTRIGDRSLVQGMFC